MKTHKIGIIMNGVTGRMGTNQHLMRSIVAIRQQGGVKLGPDETIIRAHPGGTQPRKTGEVGRAGRRRKVDHVA